MNPNYNPSDNSVSALVDGVEILLDDKAVCPVKVDAFKAANPAVTSSSLPKISIFKTPVVNKLNGISRADTLKQYIWAHGPAMSRLDASNIQSYIGGAITDPTMCSTFNDDMKHSVVIVGWKMVDNVEVWIIRNSYSSMWGDNGYMYTQISNDICGVAENAILIANANIAPANRNFLSVAAADPAWIVTRGSTKWAIG